MLQDWLKLTGTLQCCARRMHISVEKGTNCNSLVCYRGIFLQHQTLHLGPDPLWPSLISYSVRRPGLAVRPRDINMQLVVDSNAKPHNQQIINSHRTPPSPPTPPPPAWLNPRTQQFHMWKKALIACCNTSGLLHAVKPVIDYSGGRTATRSLASDHLQWGQWKSARASENMVGVWRALDADCSSTQMRGGEQVSSVHSSGIRLGTMEKLIHWNGVPSRTESLLFWEGNFECSTAAYITTHNMILDRSWVQAASEIRRLFSHGRSYIFFSLLLQFWNFLQDMMEPSKPRVYQR